MQPLCVQCHKEKSIAEKTLGTYKKKGIEISIFNKIALENIINTNAFRTWQFVEKVAIDVLPIIEIVNTVKKIKKCDPETNSIPKFTIPNITIPNTLSLKVQTNKEVPLKRPEFTNYKIDMIKCRRNLTYYSNYEFPVYSLWIMQSIFQE